MHPSRRTVRLVAAADAALMASIYFLIGLGIADIGGKPADRDFLWVFGAMAGSAFLFGALLLRFTDRRWLWVLGFAFQLLVYAGYIQVSGQRTPPFEVWGITLRIIQVPLVIALGWLAIRPVDTMVRPTI